MFSLFVLLVFVGLSCVFGTPNPLVSSSGIIQNLPNDEAGQVEMNGGATNNKDSTGARKFDSGLGLYVAASPVGLDNAKKLEQSEPLSWGTGTNSGAASFDLDENPLFWGPTRSAPKSNNVKGKTNSDRRKDKQNTDGSSSADNVIYTKEKKTVLRPYARDASSDVTIPTVIITPPTSTLSSLVKSEVVAIPQQTQGESIIINQRIRDSDTISTSAIEGGEFLANNSNQIVVNSPKFVLLNENNQFNSDIFDDSETLARVSRTSSNDNTTKVENKTTENAGSKTSKVEEDTEDSDTKTKSDVGPPWENDEIVGKLIEDPLVEPTEVSFKIATKLCQKLAGQSALKSNDPKRYYLWAPINQYLPLLRKSFPIRSPLFAPECLKWVLRQCRGTIRLPMLKPCTYWSPMPIRRPECGFNPTLQSKMVNYRIPEYVPGNCPCVWPCVSRFDPIQRCRVALKETELQMDSIHSDGEPYSEKEILIQESLALQLCRGMKLAMTVDTTINIGWIPIRADVSFTSIINDNVAKPVETPSSLRRKREQGTAKVKREKIFVKPGSNSTVSSEEDEGGKGNVKSDRFTLMGTYNLDRQVSQNANGTANMTTIKKCRVWKYKACPSDKTSQENQINKRRRRNVPIHMSSFALELASHAGINTLFENNQRIVRQAELEVDEDDPVFNRALECGEWVRTESYHCIAEEHIQVLATNAPGSSSSEEEDDKDEGDQMKTAKKTIMKNLCPGSTGKFPCFLRKKRAAEEAISQIASVEPATDTAGLEEGGSLQKLPKKRDTAKNDVDQEGEVLSSSSSIYLINKIQYRPDPGCLCDWPCLPFFDRVNQCYNSKGNVVLDNFGRPKVTARSFRKSQRDPVVCINFVESDEIYCKVKE